MERHETTDTSSPTSTAADPRRLGRLGLCLLFCATVAAVVAGVPAAIESRTDNARAELPAPTGLRTFLKTVGDTRQTTVTGIPEFARTPAFAWTPMPGAKTYEFELSTSPTSSDAGFTSADGLVWSGRVGQTPATAIPVGASATVSRRGRLRTARAADHDGRDDRRDHGDRRRVQLGDDRPRHREPHVDRRRRRR